MIHWQKLGQVYHRQREAGWWHSHTMAPSAICLNDEVIRVFLGCWDSAGISRIGYVDVSAERPNEVLAVSPKPVVDIGRPGCFDDNGVFPGHATRVGDTIYLYYTGFQLGEKIRYFNFGGLALSRDGGQSFTRVSEAPILDRADEGLSVRAGQSILHESGAFHTVYSAGSDWVNVGGYLRPTYDVYYQSSPDGLAYQRSGQRIVTHDASVEHGLGRPQLVRLGERYVVFYTRRTLDMKYHFGLSLSDDLQHWERADHLASIVHGTGFDSEMVYFPSLVSVPGSGRRFLFYAGNGFGRDGLGVAELHGDFP